MDTDAKLAKELRECVEEFNKCIEIYIRKYGLGVVLQLELSEVPRITVVSIFRRL